MSSNWWVLKGNYHRIGELLKRKCHRIGGFLKKKITIRLMGFLKNKNSMD